MEDTVKLVYRRSFPFFLCRHISIILRFVPQVAPESDTDRSQNDYSHFSRGRLSVRQSSIHPERYCCRTDHISLETENCQDANFVVTGGTGATSDNKVGILMTLDLHCLNPIGIVSTNLRTLWPHNNVSIFACLTFGITQILTLRLPWTDPIV